ncbi:MAG: 2Fe-2S iron-sulfur cluster-binding protein [Hyphomicrobiales bacterium]|nr:2Fe-2S iron-sulfur cluster-binding protein [Hyphomicrobiales bacterium]
MNGQGFRQADGQAINRDKPLRFWFDGKCYEGFAGDTLASALMANGVRLLGRSFKYHRPRGLMTIGADEPNALITVKRPGFSEPNTRATMVDLYDGLKATSQNAWPSLRFDVGAVSNAVSPFIPAGFYYKTFMGPTRHAWMFYEALIRRAAGLGRASRKPDASRYSKTNAHADVAIVGAGEAGLNEALAAGKTGARVILIDEAMQPGGWLLRERASGAIQMMIEALHGMPNVTILSRTTAFGLYDGLQMAAVERVQDHLPQIDLAAPRQRLWLIRAKRIVLAAGAIEQPLLFEGNDKPGVMLAGAARGYLNQHGAVPGRCAVIFTNNDSAYQTAFDFIAAGLKISSILDTRADLPEQLAAQARALGVSVVAQSAIDRVEYSRGLRGVHFHARGVAGKLECDVLAMSGGWAPAVHLSTHLGGRPVFDDARGLFLPARMPDGITCAGCMAGKGLPAAEPTPSSPSMRAFVDFQNDVTVKDVKLAHREGYRSVEHLKRYTTLGMGTDQGKTANIAGLSLMAGLTGQSIAATGTTTFRPPYTPVSIGALGGMETGEHLRPIRRTPMQDWHEANGGLMAVSGLWIRPKAYLKPGEDVIAAQIREARMVRQGVGIVDASTLGKIEVQGPDATEFLDRIYCSPVKSLKIGRARYGVMLREDGFVMDDGTLARLAPNHYYLTTTTAQAAKVLAHMEYHAQVTWPELRVSIISVSDQFAAIAVAGPQSRALLAGLAGAEAFDDAGFPYPSLKIITFGGVNVRVLRASYSGERAYELHAPAAYAMSLWKALLDAGAQPYGLEAMAILRIEKGHVAGAELDGRTTPADLGLAKLVRADKEFIGRRMLQRPGLSDPSRPSLVGLVPVDEASRIRSGAQITLTDDEKQPVMIGHVTSVCFSSVMGHPIALALIANASDMHQKIVFARYPLRNETVAVRIVPPVFYDPEGARLHV